MRIVSHVIKLSRISTIVIRTIKTVKKHGHEKQKSVTNEILSPESTQPSEVNEIVLRTVTQGDSSQDLINVLKKQSRKEKKIQQKI